MSHQATMPSILGIAALILVRSVSAAGPGDGTVSRDNLEVGRCEVARMTVKYNLDSLMGEPTVAGTYRWQGDGTCELHYSTTVWLKLETDNSHGYVKLAPTVPDAGEWGYNTTGSPDWDEAVCGYQGTEKGQCMTPDQAKSMWKNARVTGFEVAVDADAVNRSDSASDQGTPTASGASAEPASPEKPDAAPVGTWAVSIGNREDNRTILTLKPSGDGSYHQVGQSDHYPARWQADGNRVTMKAYGTRQHYNRDEPAVLLELRIDGDEITGTQQNLLGNMAEFRVEGTKR